MSETANKPSWSDQRKPYEFSRSVKLFALEKAKWRCQECGKTKNEAGVLEVHHIIPIWWAIKYQTLAPAVLKHVVNAKVLCQECHDSEHKKDAIIYEQLAVAILGGYMQMRIHGTNNR